MVKNPLTISYNDLIDQAQARLGWMEKDYPIRVAAGTLKQWTATHNLECQRTLVRLLKKAKREPQLDLYEAFEKMK